MFHYFADSRLLFIIKIYGQILINTIRKQNEFRIYALFPHQYATIF
jgi:hypothetical protein